jgi:GNAT superfamily N-acetyltransferase
LNPAPTEIVYEDAARDLCLSRRLGISNDYLALLDATAWGTEGVRYLSHGIGEALARVPDLRTLELRQAGALVGAYALAHKRVHIGAAEVTAVHRMFLTVAPDQGGRGYGRLIMDQTRELLRREANGPLLLYGYIEAENTRSLTIAERVGYGTAGSFRSYLFSRYSPHDDPAVTAVTPGADADELGEVLRSAYRDHAAVDLTESYDPGRCFLLREAGRIVAAAQVELRRWTITDLPGLYGRALLAVLPHTPGAKRFLPQRELLHLALGNIFVAPGCGASFARLVSALLARHARHVAIWFGDPRCPMQVEIARAGGRGLLGALGMDGDVRFVVGDQDLPQSVRDELRERPLFISTLDPI